MRPAELANDVARTADAAIHALEQAEKAGERYDIVCVLEPTAPLRTAEDIDAALSLMLERGADSVIGLKRAAFGSLRRLRAIKDGVVSQLFPESGTLGQPAEGEAVYLPGGGIFAARRELLLKERTLCGSSQAGYILPADRGLDIDTPEDMALAEALIQKWNDSPVKS